MTEKFLDILKEGKEGLDLLRILWDKLKKKEKYIVINEKEYEILRALEQMLLLPHKSIEKFKKNETLKEIIENTLKFFENFHIVKTEVDYLIIPREVVEEMIYEKIKEGKVEGIKVIPLHDETFEKFEEVERKAKKEVAEIINNLPNDIKSIINLAYEVRYFYEVGKIEIAEEIKKKIRARDKKYLKLCNCFCEGYIESLIYKYKTENTNTIVEKINELLIKPIFFIHSYMDIHDVEEIITQIKNAIQTNEKYIAIHSLGSAQTIAELIIKNISYPEGYEQWSYKDEKELTCIWFKEEGRKILELLPIYTKSTT